MFLLLTALYQNGPSANRFSRIREAIRNASVDDLDGLLRELEDLKRDFPEKGEGAERLARMAKQELAARPVVEPDGESSLEEEPGLQKPGYSSSFMDPFVLSPSFRPR